MAARRDPFTVPLVLFRVGWMNRSQGNTGGDTISPGGASVAEHGFGHEICEIQEIAARHLRGGAA